MKCNSTCGMRFLLPDHDTHVPPPKTKSTCARDLETSQVRLINENEQTSNHDQSILHLVDRNATTEASKGKAN